MSCGANGFRTRVRFLEVPDIFVGGGDFGGPNVGCFFGESHTLMRTNYSLKNIVSFVEKNKDRTLPVLFFFSGGFVRFNFGGVAVENGQRRWKKPTSIFAGLATGLSYCFPNQSKGHGVCR